MATFAGSRNLAFVIRSSKIQGKGAFATRRIKKGERIIEYLGECIDADESDIRYPDDEMGRHHTFLFSIGDGTRVLDAGPLEWPAKYVNHSCDPNCEAIEEEDGRVFVHALTTLEAGQELLYDYAYERTAEHTADDETLYKCLCGSAKCRGSILAPPKPVKAKKDKKGKARKDKKSKKEKHEKKEKKGRESTPQRSALDVELTQAANVRTIAGATVPVPVTRVTQPRTTSGGTGEPRVGTRPVGTTQTKTRTKTPANTRTKSPAKSPAKSRTKTKTKTSKRTSVAKGGSGRVAKTARTPVSKTAVSRTVAGGAKKAGKKAGRKAAR